jgi:lauroyl/myristoyl acyltransferase
MISLRKRFLASLDASLTALLYAVRFAARFLPPRFLVAGCDLLGRAAFRALSDLRESVLAAMSEALPDERDRQRLERIARGAFASPFLAMLDPVIMERHRSTIMDRLIVDESIVRRAQQLEAEGRGLIVFSPHLGAMCVSHALLRDKIRSYTPVVFQPGKTFAPRFIGTLFDLTAQVSGGAASQIFWAGEGTTDKALRHLRAGGAVGITFDLGGKTPAQFFGRPTALASGIARLACETNAPIIGGFVKRLHDPLDFELVSRGEIAYELSGELARDIGAVLDRVVEEGEALIRESPEQWIGWLGLPAWRKKAGLILDGSGVPLGSGGADRMIA